MHKYKNSILRFNPRSYLTLAHNDVNQEIASTITDRSTNEFALFNNGITMLSDETQFTENTGRISSDQLHIKNPQIINGGQTAYTLSHLYERIIDGQSDESIFGGKEVMLKVITFVHVDAPDEAAKLLLVEQISKATNKQSAVQEPDRRSNDRIQVELQRYLFETFGYFYERKEGEFFDGLTKHYISKDLLIKREPLLRVAYAISGQPIRARGTNVRVLFSQGNMIEVLNEDTDFSILFFGFRCFLLLGDLEKAYRRDQNNRFGVLNYGNALRFGKYAVIRIASSMLVEQIGPHNVDSLAHHYVSKVLDRWLAFEMFARTQSRNRQYFPIVFDPVAKEERVDPDFGGYYKGRTLEQDLAEFFGR